jgi:hypothetical protein
VGAFIMNSENGEQIVLRKGDEKNLDWCLCIFFSVDLEGATKYKNEARSNRYAVGKWKSENDWCAAFKKFYIDFPDYFRKAYTLLSAQKETEGIRQPVTPVLWKFIGDEILFYAPIEDGCQVLEHLYAFQQAITNYNNDLEQSGASFYCKGASWIAGFPLNNRIITIEGANGKQIVDFIGSSIDAGFRVAKHATSRKLVISFDLLWMLLIARQKYARVHRYNFDIRFHGEHVLKGVLNEKEYPIFWFHLWKKEDDDSWKIPPRIDNHHGDILRYCEEFSKGCDNDSFICPFVEGDPSGLFGKIPERFKKHRSQLLKFLKASEKPSPMKDEVKQCETTKTLPKNTLPLKSSGKKNST